MTYPFSNILARPRLTVTQWAIVAYALVVLMLAALGLCWSAWWLMGWLATQIGGALNG